MKLDLHVHSHASFDCNSDPAEMAAWAVRKGLDGFAITEHDTTDRIQEIERSAKAHGLFLIRGVEVTVRRGTHYLVYFTPELPLPDDDMALINEIHRRGGVIGAPHPYRSDTGLKYNQNVKSLYDASEVDEILKALDLIEAFNGKSTQRQNDMAKKLASDYPNLKEMAGSDSHFATSVGAAHTDLLGFEPGTIAEMAKQLKRVDRKIVVLPELSKSAADRAVESSTDGIRRMIVKLKPIVPDSLYNFGRSVYRAGSNRQADRRARKSVTKED